MSSEVIDVVEEKEVSGESEKVVQSVEGEPDELLEERSVAVSLTLLTALTLRAVEFSKDEETKLLSNDDSEKPLGEEPVTARRPW